MLLLAAPALGGLWVHPLSHLSIAAIVLPVAGVALWRGFRDHSRRWVVVIGGVGITLVLVGAILPYLAGSPEAGTPDSHCDQCCPSLVTDEATGEASLHVPPASVVTLLGGVALVTAHIANLRCCARCSRGAATLTS